MNDYELVVAGLANLLAQFPDQLLVCDQVVVGEPIRVPVDVALYDTYGRVGIAEPALRTLAESPGVARVAVFSLDLPPTLVADAQAAGATGFISKRLPGPEIADAIVRVAKGEVVLAVPTGPGRVASTELDWPGKEDGLTERQSQVLVLAAEGLTNREIATALYLSPETVKGYLRQVFLRLKVRNRVEATNYVRRSRDFGRHRGPPPVSDTP